MRLLLAALLAFLSAAVLAGQAKPAARPHLLIPTSADLWVCAPSEHGRSCKSALEVQQFILGNARDDCGP